MEHSCRFLSHPGLCLKDHLIDVGEKCRRKAIEIGIKDERLLAVIEIVGKFHDLGKYSKFFQEYLSYGFSGNRELARHSALSALFSGWMVSKIYTDPFLSAIAFYSVYRHHGDLADNVYEIFTPSGLEDVMSKCQKQLNSIVRGNEEISHEVCELMNSLTCKKDSTSFNDFIKEYDKGLPILRETAKKFMLRESENIFRDLYSLYLLFSLLIDFDKKAAGKVQFFEREVYSNRVTAVLVDEYVKQLSSRSGARNPMYEMRESIRRDVIESFQKIVNDGSLGSKKIMTITAPTGSGKTLLSLSVATKIREFTPGEKPRIIYVLPYVNIVEQTYEVFKNVLGCEEINLLLKHHHKAYGATFKTQTEPIPIEDMLLMTESWDSEIIVTTSVQLFETLLGSRNRMLKKFNEIFNSVIILDEVQTLPIEYWRLLKEALGELVNNSNSYIIYMSATRPIIFTGQELVNSCEEYFRRLRRVKFKYIAQDLSVNDAAKFIFSKWEFKGSLLVVLNTIKASIEFYERFKQLLIQRGIKFTTLFGDEDQINKDKLVLSYLSTNIIPLQRMKRIKRIKDLLNEGTKVILVSTQVVEAGVDLDFDVGIRDIGPFDSIVQVAGRCNRNASKKCSDFYIIRMTDDRGRLYAEKVYGKLSIRISERILNRHIEFDEAEIFDMINEYYTESIRVFGEESDEYKNFIESIKKMDLGYLKSFKIIEEEPKYSVFIEYDECALKIKKELLHLIDEKRQADKNSDKSKVYEILAKIRAKRTEIENYIVDTWVDVESLTILSDLSDIRYVSREVVKEWYDVETGLRRVEEKGAVFI